MFTGLVEGIGIVKGIRRTGNDMKLVVRPPSCMDDFKVGDSISVDGVCLTVTGFRDGLLSMDVSTETFSRSTLGHLKPGSEVNLERALRLSDRLGGHLVLGHVDGVGKILAITQRQNSWSMRVGIDGRLARYIVEKGSVAVDGISLTVNQCGEEFFEVNIIPQTGRETTISKRKVGDLVNIETDLVGKYVDKFVTGARAREKDERSRGVDREMLMRYGFGE